MNTRHRRIRRHVRSIRRAEHMVASGTVPTLDHLRKGAMGFCGTPVVVRSTGATYNRPHDPPPVPALIAKPPPVGAAGTWKRQPPGPKFVRGGMAKSKRPADAQRGR